MSSSQLTKSFFRGVGQPPTSRPIWRWTKDNLPVFRESKAETLGDIAASLSPCRAGVALPQGKWQQNLPANPELCGWSEDFLSWPQKINIRTHNFSSLQSSMWIGCLQFQAKKIPLVGSLFLHASLSPTGSSAKVPKLGGAFHRKVLGRSRQLRCFLHGRQHVTTIHLVASNWGEHRCGRRVISCVVGFTHVCSQWSFLFGSKHYIYYIFIMKVESDDQQLTPFFWDAAGSTTKHMFFGFRRNTELQSDPYCLVPCHFIAFWAFCSCWPQLAVRRTARGVWKGAGHTS